MSRDSFLSCKKLLWFPLISFAITSVPGQRIWATFSFPWSPIMLYITFTLLITVHITFNHRCLSVHLLHSICTSHWLNYLNASVSFYWIWVIMPPKYLQNWSISPSHFLSSMAPTVTNLIFLALLIQRNNDLPKYSSLHAILHWKLFQDIYFS